MSWPVVLASGGPRERGRAYGEAAAERIGRSIGIYESIFERYAAMSWSDVRARAGAFAEPIDEYDVELLPEIEGIAEGAAVDAEDVLALNVRTEVMFGLDARTSRAVARPPADECTAVAIGDGPDGPIVAQNWDWKPAARDTCVVLASTPHRRPGFVTLVEAGLLAKVGVNERRVALATNALTSSLDRADPGVPYHAVLRRVLTSETFDEATAAIVDARRASSANYLVAGPEGRIADIEALPGDAPSVHVVEATRLAHANHFTWPGPRPFEDLGRLDGEDSLQRHARVEAAIGATALDAAGVQAALADHGDGAGGEGPCVHAHDGVDPIDDYVTVASFVAALGSGATWLTDGPPCERPFERVDVPELLRDARAAGASLSASP